MIKYLAISVFNSFYYLLLSYLVLLNYKANGQEYYTVAAIVYGAALIPVIVWMNGIHKRIIVKAYFSKIDLIFKISILSIPLLFISFEYFDYNNSIFFNMLKVLFFVLLCAKLVSLYPTSRIKADIICQSTQFIQSNNTHLYLDNNNLFGIDYIFLNNMIDRYTDHIFYIVEYKKNIDYRNVSYLVVSGKTIHVLSYSNLKFILNDKIIDTNNIDSLQQEYKKSFFNMTKNELEVLEMMQI